MKRGIFRLSAVVFAAFLLALAAGCTTRSMSGDSYSRDQAQRVMTVQTGEIESVRPVKIEGTKSGMGTLAGGALGGALGSGVGRGTGRLVGAVGGAIVGGLAGSAVEESTTKADGVEITVKLDRGETVVIVQGAEPGITFAKGERVRVLRGSDGTARVTRE